MNSPPDIPENTSPSERQIAFALQPRIDLAGVSDLWNADRCPEPLLVHLAYSLSVDHWDDAWPLEYRRAVCRESIWVHRHKGTPGAVKRHLKALGFGDVAIFEAREQALYGDGQHHYGDGTWLYGSPLHWAEYDVIVYSTIYRWQAEAIEAAVRNIVPEHCRLRQVSLSSVGFVYGDGLWSFGAEIGYGSTYQMEK